MPKEETDPKERRVSERNRKDELNTDLSELSWPLLKMNPALW